uniref:Uncharacterized protein n=1 Tax=Johnson-sea-linkia profunda TaxID=575876 RepID=A0A386AXP8_9CHLO|nr:hypothetical protein [Johnson-sea-linkia profunda]
MPNNPLKNGGSFRTIKSKPSNQISFFRNNLKPKQVVGSDDLQNKFHRAEEKKIKQIIKNYEKNQPKLFRLPWSCQDRKSVSRNFLFALLYHLFRSFCSSFTLVLFFRSELFFCFFVSRISLKNSFLVYL